MAWIGPAIAAVGSIAGSLISRSGSRETAQSNEQMQRDFAQQGIRWKVADAKEAGIHPLYALGAQTMPFSPIQIGGSDYGIPDASQYIGRAINATRTEPERTNDRLENLAIERGELENELLRSQIARLNQNPNPPMPAVAGTPGLTTAIPGQQGFPSVKSSDLPSGVVEVKPAEVMTTTPGHPSIEAGANPENKWIKTERGWKAMPSKSQGLDDMDITNLEYLQWALRNRILPNFPGWGQHNPPPDHFLGPDDVGWIWIPGQNEYRPVHKSQSSWLMRRGPNFIARRN